MSLLGVMPDGDLLRAVFVYPHPPPRPPPYVLAVTATLATASVSVPSSWPGLYQAQLYRRQRNRTFPPCTFSLLEIPTLSLLERKLLVE